ncbi:MAG: hypothetical protein A3G22_06475 [Alphaproteobacteria bacterium RIFCSPLOWO2_12_FULL_40_11]|nr:MAG: hypothetical protein A2794_04195 [Alphaproteobacteria bacterium RIFCSPHIGHO2_01_FULL_40_8]OFX10240.1 MAG: hypothetical protein A3H30_05315 [Alphaproteobacteria bacterium RIFCSPLOWO2_02_FULL_40_19]OFX11824.1 MAG: hypothetical protein A3G22_06475 [Alphaproteobacteria bacterium RIFCSPLOWO2_12_FULL_40_11]
MVRKIFGLGLRHPHHQHVIQNNPKVDFFEVHTENFIAEGGASLDFLSKISELYPLSFHCVGLSLGSACGLDKKHLKSIKNLLDRFKPFLFSDHLSWSSSQDSGTSNDLLPIPYNRENLEIFCDNVNHAQDFFGRELLIENPSAYLEYEETKIPEVDFLNEIAARTNCGILLDVNNVYVSSKNFGLDPAPYFDQIDISKVKEFHLAGHSIYEYRGNKIRIPEHILHKYNGNKEIRIDTHSTHVCDEVLELYGNFVKKFKIEAPTLLEWDQEIPEFGVLFDEMQKIMSVA